MKRWMMTALLYTALALMAPLSADAQGILRVAIGTSPVNLDPAKTTIGDEYIYVHLVFNGLTKIMPDLTVEPDLALSWQASADLKTWTFKLRPGVKWHSGRLLDADDVVATMKRILDPATGSRARATLDMVDTVEAVDPLTVKFGLKYAFAGFQDMFGERQLRIVPRDGLDTLSTKPVGTGPFKFKSYTPGDRLELEKNAEYFEPGKPKLDGVTLRIIPESAARIASLESGAIDILWNAPYEAVDRLKKTSGVKVDSVATSTWDGVILNNKRKPFDDIRVRQALAATIDKEALVEIVLFGQGTPTFSPIPSSHPYFAKDLAVAQPDIAKAKKLLADAGYPSGFEVTMQVPQEREARVRLGVAVRDMAKAAGIRIDIERVPFASYTANVSGKAQIYVDGYFARPTIDAANYPFFHSNGSWNNQLWLYEDAEVDALLDRSRIEQDDAKRKEIFIAFQKRLNETVPGIIPYSAAYIDAYRSTLEGFKSTPMLWLELSGVSLKK